MSLFIVPHGSPCLCFETVPELIALAICQPGDCRKHEHWRQQKRHDSAAQSRNEIGPASCSLRVTKSAALGECRRRAKRDCNQILEFSPLRHAFPIFFSMGKGPHIQEAETVCPE